MVDDIIPLDVESSAILQDSLAILCCKVRHLIMNIRIQCLFKNKEPNIQPHMSGLRYFEQYIYAFEHVYMERAQYQMTILLLLLYIQEQIKMA